MKGMTFDPSVPAMTLHRGGGQTPLVFPGSFPGLLLPDQVTITGQAVAFPDFASDTIWHHEWRITSGGGSFHGHQLARVGVTRLPGDWSETTVLMDAPAGTNVFFGQVRLQQTSAASHNWLNNSPIARRQPENVWITAFGSLLLEQHLGLSRLMSVYLDDDPLSATYRKLVLAREQSLGPAPGGYGLLGLGEPDTVNHPSGGDSQGGERIVGTTAGWPVYYPGDTGAPHYKFQLYTHDQLHLGAGIYQVPKTFRKTASSPPSIVDPTDYSSGWLADVRGQFGRLNIPE